MFKFRAGEAVHLFNDKMAVNYIAALAHWATSAQISALVKNFPPWECEQKGVESLRMSIGGERE
eukprot:c12588_g2_i1 orf=2-190(-)